MCCEEENHAAASSILTAFVDMKKSISSMGERFDTEFMEDLHNSNTHASANLHTYVGSRRVSDMLEFHESREI